MYWLDDLTIRVHIFTNRGKAVGYLEHFLVGKDDPFIRAGPSAVISAGEAGPAKRRRINPRLRGTAGVLHVSKQLMPCYQYFRKFYD